MYSHAPRRRPELKENGRAPHHQHTTHALEGIGSCKYRPDISCVCVRIMHDKDTLKHAEERIVWLTVSFHPDVRRRKKKGNEKRRFYLA